MNPKLQMKHPYFAEKLIAQLRVHHIQITPTKFAAAFFIDFLKSYLFRNILLPYACSIATIVEIIMHGKKYFSEYLLDILVFPPLLAVFGIIFFLIFNKIFGR